MVAIVVPVVEPSEVAGTREVPTGVPRLEVVMGLVLVPDVMGAGLLEVAAVVVPPVDPPVGAPALWRE